MQSLRKFAAIVYSQESVHASNARRSRAIFQAGFLTSYVTGSMLSPFALIIYSLFPYQHRERFLVAFLISGTVALGIIGGWLDKRALAPIKESPAGSVRRVSPQDRRWKNLVNWGSFLFWLAYVCLAGIAMLGIKEGWLTQEEWLSIVGWTMLMFLVGLAIDIVVRRAILRARAGPSTLSPKELEDALVDRELRRVLLFVLVSIGQLHYQTQQAWVSLASVACAALLILWGVMLHRDATAGETDHA